MKRPTGKRYLWLVGHESSPLETLHDTICSNLDHPAKQGVKQLLQANNQSLKKNLHKYIQSFGLQDLDGLMSALDFLLELHARECYSIGFLDHLTNNSPKSPRKANVVSKELDV